MVNGYEAKVSSGAEQRALNPLPQPCGYRDTYITPIYSSQQAGALIPISQMRTEPPP